MFVLDTNVISELRKPGCQPSVREWISQRRPVDLYLASITLYELEMGVARIERRDEVQGRLLRRWLVEGVLEQFRGRILPFDSRAATLAAGFHVPNPVSERDSMIAAIAGSRGMVLVTRKTRDFEATGIAMVNPWGDEVT